MKVSLEILVNRMRGWNFFARKPVGETNFFPVRIWVTYALPAFVDSSSYVKFRPFLAKGVPLGLTEKNRLFH